MSRILYTLILALSLACGSKAPKPDACEYTGYLSMDGKYQADLVVTNVSDGEVIREDKSIVHVYHSGGPGSYWGGAVGTAYEDKVVVDMISNAFGIAVSLRGTANREGGLFTQTINVSSGSVTHSYDFTNLTVLNSATARMDAFDFVVEAMDIAYELRDEDPDEDWEE